MPDFEVPRWRSAIAYGLALIVTLYGLANVMPAIGSFRLGPFPMEFFRSTFFALCVLVVALVLPRTANQRLNRLYDGLAIIATATLLWACVEYYQVAIEIDEAMFLFGEHEKWVALSAAGAALFFCWRYWGLPVAILGILGIAYMVLGPYLPGPLQTIKGDVNELLAQNLWFSLDTGIIGATFSVVITTVFPFIILGAVLEGVGAGQSMIRIAFAMMKGTAGGPAHAAVIASGLFGSVSGSAVANVVGTGVITIPMIKQRGFSGNFSGAVEAAASTGGQIMPPIMGAAALVMADYVGVSYLTVILAVLVPALAYYLSLFLMIMFESRRLGIVAEDSSASVEPPVLQDYLNLILVFGPLLMIALLLAKGLSASGSSIAAIAMLFPLSFINPAIRQQPIKLIHALKNGGVTFAQLLMAIAAVGIVISTLSATGVPVKFGVLMSSVMGESLLLALFVVAGGCILLGMGMPTLPAYVTVAAIALPSMQSLGLAPLTAHMFVFLIAVASTITPPVAIAAYAAAAISGGKPIATGVTASRIGIMIFFIPFAFAYNPLLLTSEMAGVEFAWVPWLWLLMKLAFSMYLLGSALSRFDVSRVTLIESGLRITAAIMLFAPAAGVDMAGLILGISLLLWHRRSSTT